MSSLHINNLVFTQFAHDRPKAAQTFLPEEYKDTAFPVLGLSEDSITSTTWFVSTTASPNFRAYNFNLDEILKNKPDLRLNSSGVFSNSPRNNAAMESMTISLIFNLGTRKSKRGNTSSRWSTECKGSIKMLSRGLCGRWCLLEDS